MGRKRTAEDRRRYAEENGFDDNDTDINNDPIPRDVLEYTKGRYDVQMDLWFEYKKTHPKATPHEVKTLKHFAEFMAKSIKGVLDPDGKPTIQTVRNYFRCFASGWNIDNPKSLISRDLTDSTTNYIKGPLKRKLDLSDARRPKTYLTLENYMYMERQLWQDDWHEYVHEAYRVFISAKLKCHVFTPARLGEISEGSTRKGTGNGLRYKDTELLVAWKDGEPELRWSLKREFAKGMHDKEPQRPTHILYELLPNQPLIVNSMLFMLAIFVAARALKRYHTIEQILAVKPPADQRYWVFDWADHVLNRPIFPEVTVDGPTEKIQTGTAFSSQLRALSLRAGMEVTPTIHSSRRETLIQATGSGYPKDELMKFAAHTNQMTLTRDYLSSITSVDGMGTFLKLPLRSDQAEDFRSKTVKRNPELFTSLPAKAQDELRQKEEYVAITKQLDDLSIEISVAETQASVHELRLKRNQMYEQRRLLEKEELDRVRRTQERIHPSERQGTFHVDQGRSRFDRLRHMMPERERLSNTLFCVAPLRSPEGVSAAEDLVALLQSPCRVAYQPSLRPIHSRCPVPHCGVEIDRIRDLNGRWKHIFECSMNHHKGDDRFVDFCFICNQPVVGRAALESHCQEHIDRRELPLRCDFVKFRRAIACPGRCMTCMHNQRFPASRRLYGFKKQVSWEKHINDCFQTYTENLGKTGLFPCPNPDCSTAYESEQELWYHFQDTHSYPLRGVRTKIEKERGVFIHSEGGNAARKRLRANFDAGDSNTAPVKWANSENLSTQTSPEFDPIDLEADLDSSRASTPLSPPFDVDKALQDECLSVTSIASSPSTIEVEDFSTNEPTSSCSSTCRYLYPDVWGSAENGPDQIDDAALACDGGEMYRAASEQTQVRSLSDNPVSSSRASGSAVPSDVFAAYSGQGSSQEKGMDKSLQASSQSNVPTELIHPDLRIGNPSHQQTGSQGAVNRPAAIDEEEDIWEVEVLLAKWKQGRRTMYLIKWKGFTDEDNTWERAANISTELVDKFEKEYRDYGGNHLGVELLRKRMHHGKVEYFVRWKGRPDSENSWEKESTISPEHIREFEADMMEE